MDVIEIVVNGEAQRVPSRTTLTKLFASLELKADRIAVELNREIVRRDRWEQVELGDQDRLEIVHFVGGG